MCSKTRGNVRHLEALSASRYFFSSRKGWDHFQLGESFQDLVVLLEVSDRTIESTPGIRKNKQHDARR